MLDDGVSRLLKFLEAEAKRGFLWNLIGPPVDLTKFLPLITRAARNWVVTSRDQ